MWPATKRAILQLAQELGYPLPDSGTRLSEILLVIEGSIEMLPGGIFDPLSIYCDHYGVKLTMVVVRQQNQLRMRQWRPCDDRVIVVCPADTQTQIDIGRLRKRGHHVLVLNQPLHQGAGLCFQEVEGTRALLDQLAERGCSSVLFPQTQSSSYGTIRREATFSLALGHHETTNIIVINLKNELVVFSLPTPMRMGF